MPNRTFEYMSAYTGKAALLDLESVIHIVRSRDDKLGAWITGYPQEGGLWQGIKPDDYDRFILAWTEWKNRGDQ